MKFRVLGPEAGEQEAWCLWERLPSRGCMTPS